MKFRPLQQGFGHSNGGFALYKRALDAANETLEAPDVCLGLKNWALSPKNKALEIKKRLWTLK